MISQCIYLFRNSLEDKHAERRAKLWDKKDLQAKKETVYERVFIRESLRVIPFVLLAASFSLGGFTALTSL